MELILNAHIEEEHLVTMVTSEVIKLSHVGQWPHIWAANVKKIVKNKSNYIVQYVNGTVNSSQVKIKQCFNY